MKIVLAEEMGPWHVPSVATKKASTINMKTSETNNLTEDDLKAAKKKLESLKTQQQKLRDKEIEIRNFLAKYYHDGVEGAKTITVGETKFTVERSLTRTIGSDEAEKLSKEHSDIALACLRWKPEIVVKEYRKHTDILDDYVVTRSGLPTITFK